MITLTHLLNKSLIGLVLCSSLAVAGELEQKHTCPKNFDVLIRDKGEGYEFVSKPMEDMFCGNKFEGSYFKIVKGDSDEAITFNNEDALLVKKAANVYYHLTIARNFWINDIKSDFVKKIPQIIIRLDITNSFSDVRHFKNEELEKNNNNAWTIPEGQEPNFIKNPKKWGKEIWFSPMKQIRTSDYVTSTGNNPIHEGLLFVKDPIKQFALNSLIYTALTMTTAPAINQSLLLESAVKNLGILAVLYGSIEISKHLDKYLVDKYYYIETAMIPEIIYHEFAHIAMSDSLKTVHSVPVIEGMADYFASIIAKRSKMYERMDDFSTNSSKDTKSKTLYSPYLEGAWNATSDFTLSLLWKGKKEFEVINAKRIKKGQPVIADYDQLVFNAHFELDESSDIATGLTKALVNSCKQNCDSVRAGINTLHSVFEQKGLN